MKQTIKNYSFNASSKTVTFSDFSSISLERVYLITNVTSNTLIYQFNNPALGGSVSTNVLTLTFNTGSMSNADKLQIIYDTTVSDPNYDNTVNIQGVGGGTPVPISGTVTTSPSGTQTVSGTVAATQSGTWNVGSSTATGSAVPSNAFYIGVQGNGGNLAGVTSPQFAFDNTTIGGQFLAVGPFMVNATDNSHYDRLWGAKAAANTTGTGVPSSGTMVYDGTKFQLAVNAPTASATTGTGLLGAGILAQFNSAPPTISSGNYNVLQLDASGNLKVNVTAGTGSSTQITDGTNTANVVANDSGYNGQVVNNGTKVLTFSTSSTGAQTILANTDIRGYGWIEVVFTSTGAGLAVNGQFAPNSGGTYTNPVTWLSSGTSNSTPAALGTTANNIYSSPTLGAYFQIAISAMTSGTTAGYVLLHAFPRPYQSAGASAVQNGAWSIGSSTATGSAVPANAFYMAGNIGGNLGGFNLDNGSFDGGSTGTNNLDVLAKPMLYNGTNWDRTRSATAAAATTGTGLLGAGVLGIFNSSPPTVSNGNYERLQIDSSGNLKVNIAAGSGTAATSIAAAATGGYTPGKLISAATTNATSVKASAGTLAKLSVGNVSATIYYLKMYDKASAPTVGTDTPVAVYVIPANTNGAGTNIALPAAGEKYTNGIAFAITGGIADSDTTACSLNAVVVSYAFN